MPDPESQSHAENSGNNNTDPTNANDPPVKPGFWKNPNHWVAIATIVIAVANGLYTFFALQQWRTMQATLNEMRRSGQSATDQANRIIGNLNWNARAVQESLNESRISNDKTGKRAQSALKASIANFHQEQRAWISPLNAFFSEILAKAKAPRIEVQYGNVGRQPALDVRAIFKIKPMSIATFENNTFNSIVEADDICKDVKIAPGADAIYPGQPNGYKLLITLPVPTDDIINGQSAWVLEMCMAYKTVEEIHHTAFCYFYRANTIMADPRQLSICTAGNHAN